MRNVLKKLTAFMLAVVVTCACIPVIPASAATYADFKVGQTLIVTAPDGVNMHSSKEVLTTNKLATLGRGTHLYVNEIDSTGWMYVTSGGHTGWVQATTDGWFEEYTVASDETVTAYSESMQAKVLASALNVHEKPVKLSSNVLDDLYKGQVVDAVGYTSTGWVKVSYYRGTNKIVGYVASELVSVFKKTTTEVMESFETISGYSAVVKTSASPLNVHCSPSTSADVITTLSPGTVVNILAQSNSWYRISLNVGGYIRTGYIYRAYTTKTDAMSNLKLSATKKTIKVGKKFRLLVRGNTGMELTCTWKSNKKSVATVSKTGYVKGKKAGTAKITCTIKVGNRTKKLTCKVKVKEK